MSFEIDAERCSKSFFALKRYGSAHFIDEFFANWKAISRHFKKFFLILLGDAAAGVNDTQLDVYEAFVADVDGVGFTVLQGVATEGATGFEFTRLIFEVYENSYCSFLGCVLNSIF